MLNQNLLVDIQSKSIDFRHRIKKTIEYRTEDRTIHYLAPGWADEDGLLILIEIKETTTSRHYIQPIKCKAKRKSSEPTSIAFLDTSYPVNPDLVFSIGTLDN